MKTYVIAITKGLVAVHTLTELIMNPLNRRERMIVKSGRF